MMIRTLDEMEKDDKAYNGESISDQLAFCIVAGDYLRARRRRFPASVIFKANRIVPITVYDNVIMLDSNNYYITIKSSFFHSIYGTLKNGFTHFTALWNLDKEYVDD